MTTHVRRSPLALTVLALLHHEPLHPYGIQRLIRQWGKDQVINVGQAASLYRTIERLLAADLVAVQETGRDQRYPERTVYQVTDAGRAVTNAWLEEMLATPRREFPEFPAALSFVVMLGPERARTVLARRVDALEQALAAMDAETKAAAGMPRVVMLENEYLRTVTASELHWLRSVVADLDSGRLSWDRDSLIAFAQAGTPGPGQQPES